MIDRVKATGGTGSNTANKESRSSRHLVISLANRVVFRNSLGVVRLKVISRMTAESCLAFILHLRL